MPLWWFDSRLCKNTKTSNIRYITLVLNWMKMKLTVFTQSINIYRYIKTVANYFLSCKILHALNKTILYPLRKHKFQLDIWQKSLIWNSRWRGQRSCLFGNDMLLVLKPVFQPNQFRMTCSFEMLSSHNSCYLNIAVAVDCNIH